MRTNLHCKLGVVTKYSGQHRPYTCSILKAKPVQLQLGNNWVFRALNSSESGNQETEGKQTIWHWESSDDAIGAYMVLLGIIVCGTLPDVVGQGSNAACMPYFAALAASTIYIGSHRGLNEGTQRQIGIRDGFLAPVLFSFSLFSIYTILKYFPNFNLKTIFDCYFWLLGSLSLTHAFWGPAATLSHKLGLRQFIFTLPEWAELVDDNGSKSSLVEISLLNALVVVLGIGAACLDFQLSHQNHTLNNLLATAIAADVLQLLGLKSFRAAALFLVGLLCYDVFWVFASPAVAGENVMLKVATSNAMSGPTKLLFPRIPGSVSEAADFPFSLLGLGDIVVPGLLAGLALKYDASRAVDMRSRGVAAAEAIQDVLETMSPNATNRQVAEAAADAADVAYDLVADAQTEGRRRTGADGGDGMPLSNASLSAATDSVLVQRTYFVPSLIAYVAGLGLTYAANTYMGLAQPALLYLVPSMLGTLTLIAWSRGEVGKLWRYTDINRSKEV